MHLARRHMDDIARADLVPLALGGEDAAALDAVQDLGHLVRVQLDARARAEANDDDLDTLGARDDRLHSYLADEELLAGGDGGFWGDAMDFHAVSELKARADTVLDKGVWEAGG